MNGLLLTLLVAVCAVSGVVIRRLRKRLAAFEAQAAIDAEAERIVDRWDANASEMKRWLRESARAHHAMFRGLRRTACIAGGRAAIARVRELGRVPTEDERLH